MEQYKIEFNAKIISIPACLISFKIERKHYFAQTKGQKEIRRSESK